MASRLRKVFETFAHFADRVPGSMDFSEATSSSPWSDRAVTAQQTMAEDPFLGLVARRAPREAAQLLGKRLDCRLSKATRP